MARIRTVKPEFWQDEDLSSVCETARLLAIGLLNLADDEGYFNANSRLIECAIFPLSEPSVSVHECLNQLSNIGYLAVRKHESGKVFGLVTNFSKHQKVNRPSPSKIKELFEFSDSSVNTHGGITPGKEQGKEQGKESKPMSSHDDSPAKPAAAEVSQQAMEVFTFWLEAMGKNPARTRPTAKRIDKVKARLKEGYSVDDLKAAITGCAKSPHHMVQNDRGTVYDDLELICRDGTKVEQFRDNYGKVIHERQNSANGWAGKGPDLSVADRIRLANGIEPEAYRKRREAMGQNGGDLRKQVDQAGGGNTFEHMGEPDRQPERLGYQEGLGPVYDQDSEWE